MDLLNRKVKHSKFGDGTIEYINDSKKFGILWAPQVDFQKDDQPVDDGTMNVLMLCLGAMNGIQEAVAAIKGLAKGLASGIRLIMTKLL